MSSSDLFNSEPLTIKRAFLNNLEGHFVLFFTDFSQKIFETTKIIFNILSIVYFPLFARKAGGEAYKQKSYSKINRI